LEKNDYERIATLETQLETLTKSVERIETKLDLLTSSFITRNEADIRFQNLKEEIEELKQNKRANSALMVSVISVAVTFIFALLNLLKG
jgi:archaellum component FlaC